MRLESGSSWLSPSCEGVCLGSGKNPLESLALRSRFRQEGHVMIVVIDYGLGNLRSIENMLHRAGVETAISRSPDILRAASMLILPGVGHFRFGMESLRK